MSAPADEAVPALPRGVKLREDRARGGWTLMAPERVIRLDSIALEVLKRVDGQTAVSAIVDGLARDFSAPRDRIDTDVKALLGTLAEKRLLDL
jgi:pyrroloquinoline quinone biosynthesis protein D